MPRRHSRAAALASRTWGTLQVDEHGRPEPPLAGTEAEMLVAFLELQRGTIAWRTRGLSDEQLRQPLHPTAMTLGGLLKHLARVEDGWFSDVVAEGGPQEPWASTPWAQEWTTAGEDSGAALRALWEASVQRSRAVVAAALADGGLDATHPAWGGQGRPSLRWVLLHMVEEYARHCGHADLLREAVDGETGE